MGLTAVLALPMALLSAPPPAASAQERATDVAAVVDGHTITLATLDSLAGARLNQAKAQRYRVRRQVLEDRISRVLLENEAQRQGLTVDQLSRKEIDDKARPVGAEEAAAVYGATKGQFPGRSEVEALAEITAGMRRQRIGERRVAFLAALRSKARIENKLTPPQIVASADDDPALGPASAPVTVIEFSDFQCPYCAKLAPSLRALQQRYGDKVRVVFRDFPLPSHAFAAKAAEAAQCAHDQARFWEMHDKLFANQSRLDVSDLKRFAIELALDSKEFDQCLDSGRHAEEWRKDQQDGNEYGVTGTPSIFVNGRPVSSAQSVDELAVIIDEELRKISGQP